MVEEGGVDVAPDRKLELKVRLRRSLISLTWMVKLV